MTKTTLMKVGEYTPQWYVVDADKQIVGRLATQIAMVLMGKHKPTYTPHVLTGDFVIVLNAERVRFSGNSMAHPKHPYFSTKMSKKFYEKYTGYPGGQRQVAAIDVWQRAPERILEEAVRRMLPKNKLGDQMLLRLKLYAGTEHPHQSQQPLPFPAHLMP